VPRNIFGPKTEEVTGRRRKLHNKIHYLYFSDNIIKSRRVRWAGHVAHTEAMRNAYNILIRKSKNEITLGALGMGSEDNTKMKHSEIGY
jgi:hypothetical protein